MAVIGGKVEVDNKGGGSLVAIEREVKRKMLKTRTSGGGDSGGDGQAVEISIGDCRSTVTVNRWRSATMVEISGCGPAPWRGNQVIGLAFGGWKIGKRKARGG